MRLLEQLSLSLLVHEHFVEAQYAYHSASPYGPWSPVRVATPKGVNLPPGDIWFGPHCQRTGGDPSGPINPLSCGGNNPSPYFVTRETAAATGFPVRPIQPERRAQQDVHQHCLQCFWTPLTFLPFRRAACGVW
jgi:hypothetical protein